VQLDPRTHDFQPVFGEYDSKGGQGRTMQVVGGVVLTQLQSLGRPLHGPYGVTPKLILIRVIVR